MSTPALSCLVVVNDNAATAFLLQLRLQRAQLAEQVAVAANVTDALAQLSRPEGTVPLRSCVLLVDLYYLLRGDEPCLPAVPPNVHLVGTHYAPVPISLLERVQQLPLAGLLELPLSELGLALLRQLGALYGSPCASSTRELS